MTQQALLDALDNLEKDEFQRFKWNLKNFKNISRKKLEDATTLDTVDLMIQAYTPPEALVMTKEILQTINRNDLVHDLVAFSWERERDDEETSSESDGEEEEEEEEEEEN